MKHNLTVLLGVKSIHQIWEPVPFRHFAASTRTLHCPGQVSSERLSRPVSGTSPAASTTYHAGAPPVSTNRWDLQPRGSDKLFVRGEPSQVTIETQLSLMDRAVGLSHVSSFQYHLVRYAVRPNLKIKGWPYK